MKQYILVSTAYLPPIEYFSVISKEDKVLVETNENYLKQSYRNRCYILSAHGPQLLTIPVYMGSIHKTPIIDIRIDYSKRWQQVHLGAMTSSYNASPYFKYYFDDIERSIMKNHEFLLDLNMELTISLLGMLKVKTKLNPTSVFEPAGNQEYDFRYKISPKKESISIQKEYYQVFNSEKGFIPGLSIVDLLFNQGPESIGYIL